MVILNKLEEATTPEELVTKFNCYFNTIQKANSKSDLEEAFFKAYLEISIAFNHGGLKLSELGLKVLLGPEKSKA